MHSLSWRLLPQNPLPFMQQTNAAAFFHPFYTGDINPGIVESNRLVCLPACLHTTNMGKIFLGVLSEKEFSDNALVESNISVATALYV